MDEGIILRAFNASYLTFAQSHVALSASPLLAAQDALYERYLAASGALEPAPALEALGSFLPPAAAPGASLPALTLEDFTGELLKVSTCAGAEDGLDEYERALLQMDNEEVVKEEEEEEEEEEGEEAEAERGVSVEEFVGPEECPGSSGSGAKRKRGSSDAELEIPPAMPPPRLHAYALAWWQWGKEGKPFPSS
jgi:hypothetical protein